MNHENTKERKHENSNGPTLFALVRE